MRRIRDRGGVPWKASTLLWARESAVCRGVAIARLHTEGFIHDSVRVSSREADLVSTWLKPNGQNTMLIGVREPNSRTIEFSHVDLRANKSRGATEGARALVAARVGWFLHDDQGAPAWGLGVAVCGKNEGADDT